MLRGRLLLEYRPCGELRVKTRLFSSDELSLQLGRQDDAPLSKAVNSKSSAGNIKSQKGFGQSPSPTIFTVYAKRFVEDAAAVIESLYGKQVIFATLTLPGSTDSANQALCDYSAYVVSRFQQWLRDTAPDSDWVYVWERQTRGSLHMHAAIGNKDVLKLRKVEALIKNFWCELLGLISDRANVDLFARAQGGTWRNNWEHIKANAKAVRKSIRHYLAKYMSKNTIARSQLKQDASGKKYYFPTRWWGCTNRVRRMVREQRTCIASATCSPVSLRAVVREVTKYANREKIFNVKFGNKWRFGDNTTVLRAEPDVIERLKTWCAQFAIFGDTVHGIESLLKRKQPDRISRAVNLWMKALDGQALNVTARTRCCQSKA